MKKKKSQGKDGRLKGIIPMDSLGNIFENKLKAMSDESFDHLSDDDKLAFALMYQMADAGVTPGDYVDFYNLYSMTHELLDGLSEKCSASAHDDNILEFVPERRSFACVKEYEPLKDADNTTLVLKVQMKDVSKPPMWREVKVPAYYNFEQLHEVIQAVTGLQNCHLWQFNVKAYDSSLLISMNNEGDFGGPTHEADKTPLTMFLQQKGDKLEYVYDFGDDWIFTVEVKGVESIHSESPVCTKFKGRLNAMEDMGGIYAYCAMRDDFETWGEKTKREQRKSASNACFDSASEYYEFLMENMFSLDEVNGYLCGI